VSVDINSFIRLFDTVGYPVLTALALGYCLFWFMRWLVSRFTRDLQKEYDHLHQELNDLGREITESRVMLVRLIDRVRLLSEEIYSHDVVARTVWGLNPRVDRSRTKSERRESLEDELADIGSNAIPSDVRSKRTPSE
jgi:hypothetical protein